MDQANDQQPEPSPVAVTRTLLRPPGTVKKPPATSIAQNTRLTSYIAQNRFRLLNSGPASAAVTNSGTILRPLQRLQQQAEHLNQSQFITSSSVNNNNTITHGPTLSNHSQLQQPSRVTASATQIPPPSYSGLARPTPLQQIVSSTGSKTPRKPISGNVAQTKNSLTATRNNFGSSSQLRPAHNLATHRSPSQALSGSHSKLASMQLRPRTATTIVRPKTVAQSVVSSTTIEKRKASPVSKLDEAFAASDARFRSQQQPGPEDAQKTDDKPAYLIDLSTVENDVGEIRRLLEQLLCLLQMAHQDQDNKERENERLKQEVRELKTKIRSIRSTVAANADSEPPTPNIPQHVSHRRHHYDLQEESPPVDSETRNDAFTTVRHINDDTIADDRLNYGDGSEAAGNNQQHQQSVYLSPLN